MKTRSLPFFVAFVSIILLAIPSVASSKNEPVSIKLGVVNLDDVTRLSLMSKDIARQIDAGARNFATKLKKKKKASENLLMSSKNSG